MSLVVGLTRFLILCAFVLLLPALATSQTPQPTPGWYKNSGPSIMYEAPSQNSILRVVWENSYIYQHPGTDNLYWYAQVAYQNIGSQPLPVICPGATDPSIAKEHILGGIQEPPGDRSRTRADFTANVQVLCR